MAINSATSVAGSGDMTTCALTQMRSRFTRSLTACAAAATLPSANSARMSSKSVAIDAAFVARTVVMHVVHAVMMTAVTLVAMPACSPVARQSALCAAAALMTRTAVAVVITVKHVIAAKCANAVKVAHACT